MKSRRNTLKEQKTALKKDEKETASLEAKKAKADAKHINDVLEFGEMRH